MTTKKHKGGPWPKGVSGNPAGRAKGVGAISKLRALMDPEMPELVAKLIQQAKDGDTTAARILIDRHYPMPKDSAVLIPELSKAKTQTEKAACVVAALASGDITPVQAAGVMASLASLAKIVETDELTQRIEDLEKCRAR